MVDWRRVAVLVVPPAALVAALYLANAAYGTVRLQGPVVAALWFIGWKAAGYGVFAFTLVKGNGMSGAGAVKLVALRTALGLVAGPLAWMAFFIFAPVALLPVRLLLWWVAVRACYDGRPLGPAGAWGVAVVGTALSYLLDLPAGLGALELSGLNLKVC